VLGGTIQGGYDGYGMVVSNKAVATLLGRGTIQGGQYRAGMVVSKAVATVLGGTIQGGQYRGGMSVYSEAVVTVLGGKIQGPNYGMQVLPGSVTTVCDGTIQGGTNGYGMSVRSRGEARVRIAGGIIIGGNSTYSYHRDQGNAFNQWNNWKYSGDATITGGTFKGGFYSASGDQAPSLNIYCGNTSIYGGTYEGNWTFYDHRCDSNTKAKVYGKDLVVEDSHLMGTLCDGNLIDVYIDDPSTVYTENNCTSFPVFDECGGKGGKSGKKTKSTLFRP
jgi:hypothetical protein